LICRHGSSRRVLVKISDRGGGPGVAREGEVLSLLKPLTRGPCPLLLPKLLAFDPELGLVAVAWLTRSETLHRYHRRTRRYPVALARQLGGAIGHLHRLSQEQAERFGPKEALFEPGDLLECFVRLRPEFYARLSLAGVKLFSSVQNDRGALRGLQRLTSRWPPGESVLLHGDLKQANWLRVPRRGGHQVVLLDWELSAWGDPARDLGAVVADYALATLAPERPEERLSASTLRKMMGALLKAYALERGITVEGPFQQRIARWVGVALLFYVYGMTHYEGELSERGSCLIGHATHLLAEPEQWPALLWGA
jgi:hypothetical protein